MPTLRFVILLAIVATLAGCLTGVIASDETDGGADARPLADANMTDTAVILPIVSVRALPSPTTSGDLIAVEHPDHYHEIAFIADRTVTGGSADNMELVVPLLIAGNATLNTDYSLSMPAFRFSPNVFEAQIVLQPIYDGIQELGGESVAITLATNDTQYLGGTPGPHKRFIADSPYGPVADLTGNNNDGSTLTINQGEPVDLWVMAFASQCQIYGGEFGAKGQIIPFGGPHNWRHTTYPAQNTTYNLSCIGWMATQANDTLHIVVIGP